PDDGQRVLGEHPYRDLRRDTRRRDHPPDPGLRTGLRRRSGRWLRGHAHRSRDRRQRGRAGHPPKPIEGGDLMGRQSGVAFSRVVVVDRGEPAMRLINAVREWNAEGRQPLRVIALYAAADRRATFVREADEALMIGPDPDSGEDTGAVSASPYLDFAELERVLVKCRADAVWPGWGLVSEKAELAELCDRLGIIFIGPPAEVMRRLGDKIESKRLAERAGVPLAACSGPVTS